MYVFFFLNAVELQSLWDTHTNTQRQQSNLVGLAWLDLTWPGVSLAWLSLDWGWLVLAWWLGLAWGWADDCYKYSPARVPKESYSILLSRAVTILLFYVLGPACTAVCTPNGPLLCKLL